MKQTGNASVEETFLAPPRVKLNEPAELLSVIPAMLGFKPKESVVIMVIENNCVEVTIRMDICQLEFDLERFIDLREKYPGALFFVAAYSVDLGLASSCAGRIERLVGDALMMSVVSNGRSFWIRGEAEPRRRPVPEISLTARAEFAGAGMRMFEDRSDLVALVQPAEGELANENMVLMAELVEEITTMKEKDAVERFKFLMANQEVLSKRQLLEIGMLTSRYWTLICALSRISSRRAIPECELWQKVCRQMPKQYALTAIALTAISAWAGGNGALQSICLDIGSQIDPNSVLLQIPITANQMLQPPTEWEPMRQIFLSEFLNWQDTFEKAEV